MNRRHFLGAAAASTVVASPFAALAEAFVGRTLTQADLFATLPKPATGDWSRVIMGSGVQYDKQIGFGTERDPQGGASLLFVETQIGEAGGIACNPNTLRKTYLRDAHFGSLVREASVLAIVAHSGNMLTRWADVGAGQPQEAHDAKLRLLDASYLYDARPMRVRSVSSEIVRVGGRAHTGTRVIADFPAGERLRALEIVHTPAVPFGIARYKATVRELDPFGLALRSYGRDFKTGIATPLALLRPMTQSGIMTTE
ncbi:MAG: hypothetical protein NVS4B5_16600 [Vulcanimicrobiaceae bacterium]